MIALSSFVEMPIRKVSPANVFETKYALSAFGAAGLVFAGITDTPAIGMLIALMPWNNRSPSNPGPCCS